MPTVKVDDGKVDIYYELHGEGPEKVLFITGFVTSYKTWRRQIEFFKNKRRYQICVFDNRGNGRSSNPGSAWSIKRMAMDALELVDKALHWTQFHIVGLSMGGMIAQELASLLLQHKKKPKKDAQPTTVSVNPNEPNASSKPQPSSTENRALSLTLAVTHAGGFYSVPQVSTIWRLLTLRLFARTIEQEAESILPVLYSHKFLKTPLAQYLSELRRKYGMNFKEWGSIVKNQEIEHMEKTDGKESGKNTQKIPTVFDFLKEEWVEIRRSEPDMSISGAAKQIGAIMGHYVTNSNLEFIGEHIPTLLIAATGDVMVRCENTHAMKQVMKNAQFISFDGSGHMVHIECEYEFNKAAYEHIEAHSKRLAKL
jgi:pimeloyl-ACP methyl ester carboxylesterase